MDSTGHYSPGLSFSLVLLDENIDTSMSRHPSISVSEVTSSACTEPPQRAITGTGGTTELCPWREVATNIIDRDLM